jgi:hypothetical protein
VVGKKAFSHQFPVTAVPDLLCACETCICATSGSALSESRISDSSRTETCMAGADFSSELQIPIPGAPVQNFHIWMQDLHRNPAEPLAIGWKTE